LKGALVVRSGAFLFWACVAAVCMSWVFWRLWDRAPPARRFAGQARSHICCNVPNLSGHGCQPWWDGCISGLALLPPHWSQALHQDWQRLSHRHGHVATNVGAGLSREAPRGRRSTSQAQKVSRRIPAKRRAGGARSPRRHKAHARNLASATQFPLAILWWHPNKSC
jgi:hypothetical protein